MLRAWILSFFAVALVVAGILWFTREDENKAGKQPNPDAQLTRPQALTNNDVLKYIEVWPKVDAVLIASMQAGNPPGPETRDARREVLTLHGLSEQSWESLWRRVEDGINGIRAEQENPRRLAKLDRLIETRKAALDAADGAVKEQLAKDIAKFQAERDRTIKPIHPTDRKTLMRYWDQLNAMAPRLRPQ